MTGQEPGPSGQAAGRTSRTKRVDSPTGGYTTQVADLGPRGDKPPHERGFVVLGMPIRHPAFMQQWEEERLQEEQRVLHENPRTPRPTVCLAAVRPLQGMRRRSALSEAGRAWPAASGAAADNPAFQLVVDLADIAGLNTLPFRT